MTDEILKRFINSRAGQPKRETDRLAQILLTHPPSTYSQKPPDVPPDNPDGNKPTARKKKAATFGMGM